MRRGTVCTHDIVLPATSTQIQSAPLRTLEGEPPGEMQACGITRVEYPSASSGREQAASAWYVPRPHPCFLILLLYILRDIPEAGSTQKNKTQRMPDAPRSEGCTNTWPENEDACTKRFLWPLTTFHWTSVVLQSSVQNALRRIFPTDFN